MSEPTLRGYKFPNPLDERFFDDIPEKIGRFPDRFRVFYIGFSLFERAWILRGMENLLMDFIDHPDFTQELLQAITDYNIILHKADGQWRFMEDCPHKKLCPMAPRNKCVRRAVNC